VRTWAIITSALFFIAATAAGLSGEVFSCCLFSFSGGAFAGIALS
jgi:hypothetical protein